ncbi:MAG: hypothetical protein GX651_00445 [Methanomicrobiales archaeon]|nr:hypothetical protein [Methanomicrobiales archaeon]
MLPATTLPITSLTQIPREEPANCTSHFTGSGTPETGSDGRLNCTTFISTGDAVVTLQIAAGTIIDNQGSSTVTEIRIEPANPASIPQVSSDGGALTGYTYRFLPGAISFDPPVLVSFTMKPADWERAGGYGLVLRESTSDGSGWEDLPTSIDAARRTVSAPARHFSYIGLFAPGLVTAAEDTPQTVSDLIHTATAANEDVPLPLSSVIPDKYAPVAAVAAGTALSLVGTMAAVNSVLSRLWERFMELLAKFFSFETTAQLNLREVQKRKILPKDDLHSVMLGLSPRELLVIGTSAVVFAAAFLIRDRFELKIATILIFVCVGGVSTILRDLAQKIVAYRAGYVTEYQFWGLGTATMLCTAWLFGNVFAKPSRTLMRSGTTPSPKESARIKMAGPLMSLLLAILSLFLIPLGGLFVTAGSAGFTMNLIFCVFSLIPIKPNGGVDILAWNKFVWAAVFFPMMALYLFIYLQ